MVSKLAGNMNLSPRSSLEENFIFKDTKRERERGYRESTGVAFFFCYLRLNNCHPLEKSYDKKENDKEPK